MINDEADEVTGELFKSSKNKYQNNLESMKGSEFVFDYVHLLYYKCYKINPNHGGTCIHSPNWMKNKKAIINPINKKEFLISIKNLIKHHSFLMRILNL